MLPSIPDTFRTISRFTNVSGGRPWSVTMDYQRPAAGAGSAADLAQAIADGWEALFAGIIGSLTWADYFADGVDLQEVVCYFLEGDSAPSTATPSTPVVGAGTEAMAPDLALVVSKRTGTRGRSGRGRVYLGGLDNRWMSLDGSGLYGLSVTQAMQTAFSNEFLSLSGATGGPYDMVVISQATVPTGTALPVEQLLIDRNPDVQRRRGQR